MHSSKKILPRAYYKIEIVSRETSEFLRGRWVAVHCSRRMKDRRLVLVRYWRGKPLTVSSPAELRGLVRALSKLGVRAFYGSASIYGRLRRREDALDYLGNVVARTPTWDIDSRPEWWRATLEVGRAIVDVLEEEGVIESVWLKWSGRGLHVHVHERAFSSDLYRRYHPIDVSWAVVEYVLRKVEPVIRAANAKYGTSIKAENLMDPQRVFTAPLSLHRELDVACVAFKPGEVDEFDPSWLDPLKPRHNTEWRRYVEGEGDSLAEKALEEVGGYPRPIRGFKRSTGLRVEDVARLAPPWIEDMGRLRLNLKPMGPGGRDLSKGPEEAVALLEDVLSMYVLGEMRLGEAVNLLRGIVDRSLRAQGYTRDVKERLIGLYLATIEKLLELEDRDSLRAWLLSHGPPRESTLKRHDDEQSQA